MLGVDLKEFEGRAGFQAGDFGFAGERVAGLARLPAGGGGAGGIAKESSVGLAFSDWGPVE